tara:strand:+ start:52709 stop:53884 length:1176 start_codon:yes stop_codon:yes gene_type:complete
MNTSRTISGLICLTLICVPIVLAPWRLEPSIEFVTKMENRAPHDFPKLANPTDLLDHNWYKLVSDAFQDRVPYRKELMSLSTTIGLGASDGMSSKVVALGKDGWLFWYMALAEDFGSMNHTEQAIAAMDMFIANERYSGDLFIMAAPDKATIYPEQLNEESFALYEPSIPQRTRLHDWFAANPSVALDLWTKLGELKADHDGLIYEPAGTHYNSIGAMVLAKAMVDAASPGLWESDWNQNEFIDLWTRTEPPELALRGGLWDRTETTTRSQVQRQGVELIELLDAGEPVKEPGFLSITELTYHNNKRAISRSQSRPMVAGRTLVIHDSFIAVYLLPTLTQYFEDIEFIHVGYLTPAEFRAALDTYDRVYFESAEHYFPERAIEYFEGGHQQ